MSSISTMKGDTGQTALVGGTRVSKASPRVETYGEIDELISTLGVARSMCDDEEIVALTKSIQKDLFSIGSALATPDESRKAPLVIDEVFVDRLTAEVHRLEAIEGLLSDWALPGEHRAAAYYDLARTVCRRAERHIVWFEEAEARIQPAILAYINRLSDLLWLFGRKLEHDAGVDGSLRRVTGREGRAFSRAW